MMVTNVSMVATILVRKGIFRKGLIDNVVDSIFGLGNYFGFFWCAVNLFLNFIFILREKWISYGRFIVLDHCQNHYN